MAMQCRVKDRDAAHVPSLHSGVGLGRAWLPEDLLIRFRCSEFYDCFFLFQNIFPNLASLLPGPASVYSRYDGFIHHRANIVKESVTFFRNDL